MIEEKPKSMSLSNFFIKKTAIKTLVPESVVDLVIKDQWKQLNDAIKSHEHVEHEISGFGYFKISPVKLASQLNRYTKIFNALLLKRDKLIRENKLSGINVTDIRADAVQKTIESLIQKKQAYESRLERTVKWDSEPVYRSAVDKRNSQREAGDMQNL